MKKSIKSAVAVPTPTVFGKKMTPKQAKAFTKTEVITPAELTAVKTRKAMSAKTPRVVKATVSNASIILSLVQGVSYVTSAVKQLTQLRGSKYDTAWEGLKANGVACNYVAIRGAVDAIDYSALGLDNKGLGGLKSRITMGIARAAGLYKIVGTKLSKVELKDRNTCFEVKPAKTYTFDREELNKAMLALFK